MSDEEKIDINLFHYYAKECDSYLKQINSTIYPPNYTTNLLEMLARSFETFLNEKKDEKPEFNPYFALPQGIEKHDFYKKWKKVGYEIKKAHIIINPKEYEPLKIHHVSQKKKNIK